MTYFVENMSDDAINVEFKTFFYINPKKLPPRWVNSFYLFQVNKPVVWFVIF